MRLRRHLLDSRDEGFTLVELVVAMFIIAIVLVSLIGVQLSSMVTISNATKRQQATAYANQAMETLRAMPWDTLNKGNVPGFQSVSGNLDPYYSGSNSAGTVTVDGETYTVRLATSNTQNLASPRPPLFDATGKNVVISTDPAIPGFTFTTRAYIVDSLAGTQASVGLLVIVSWQDQKTGERDDLALRSSAFPGSEGCGKLEELPYLVSCQDRFTFAASSGSVTTSLSSTETDSTMQIELLEGSGLRELAVTSGLVSASGESVQVTSTEGKARRGGVVSTQLPATAADPGTTTETGFSETATEASNNFALANGAPVDDQSLVSAAGSSQQSLSVGSWVLKAKGDDVRSGTSRSSTTQSCFASGLYAGSPCSYTDLSGAGDLEMSVSVASNTMYPVVRRGTAASTAGGGRFTTSVPGTAFGCQTLSSSGCTSASGTFKETQLGIGYLAGGWGGGSDYLVEVSYQDSVLGQRGASQMAVAPTVTRSATVKLSSGSPISIGASSSGVIATGAPVTWSPTGGVVVTATAAVSATPASTTQVGEDPVVDCSTDVCAVTANAGSITVSVKYQVVTSTGSWDMYQNTVIAGSSVSASYERRNG
ncbi:type IV pilus modification PilV family protein [Demequina subtropica]|uniref:type IV pilus modification PilV family protein n=1 Tax=Demequina subtropica TaxID=1638989 RepID=UPI001E59517C|nr:type II secretion system protein [Demequina subtropica]